ncbi:hypothetical protein ABPG72_005931 [Tetrahymena utriculariae]
MSTLKQKLYNLLKSNFTLKCFNTTSVCFEFYNFFWIRIKIHFKQKKVGATRIKILDRLIEKKEENVLFSYFMSKKWQKDDIFLLLVLLFHQFQYDQSINIQQTQKNEGLIIIYKNIYILRRVNYFLFFAILRQSKHLFLFAILFIPAYMLYAALKSIIIEFNKIIFHIILHKKVEILLICFQLENIQSCFLFIITKYLSKKRYLNNQEDNLEKQTAFETMIIFQLSLL